MIPEGTQMTIRGLEKRCGWDTANEIAQHHLADLEVGDHAVLQWPDRLDVARRPANHPLGLDTDCERVSVLDIDRDDRRLVENYATTDVDERVSGAEVDGHVTTDEGEPAFRHTSAPGLGGLVPPGSGMRAQVTRAVGVHDRQRPAAAGPEQARGGAGARAHPGDNGAGRRQRRDLRP